MEEGGADQLCWLSKFFLAIVSCLYFFQQNNSREKVRKCMQSVFMYIFFLFTTIINLLIQLDLQFSMTLFFIYACELYFIFLSDLRGRVDSKTWWLFLKSCFKFIQSPNNIIHSLVTKTQLHSINQDHLRQWKFSLCDLFCFQSLEKTEQRLFFSLTL